MRRRHRPGRRDRMGHRSRTLNTPIYDFVNAYIEKNSVRAHMPGHKGMEFTGGEARDITEIAGADILADSTGILGESQRNASRLFRTGATLYSTEGSSLAIKAMLYCALLKWRSDMHLKEPPACRPVVLAGRNVHRAMIDGCALLDLDVEFIRTDEEQGLCRASINPQRVEEEVRHLGQRLAAVYVTSPDYLGGQCDIAGLAKVCHAQNVPLLVDNAHGAYLAFLDSVKSISKSATKDADKEILKLHTSAHPIALGADMCCDSAHKTFPVLTGGAYLHLHHRVSGTLEEAARKGMALFGSTSPSYLILQSLDYCNYYLDSSFKRELAECVRKIGQVKEKMRCAGIEVMEGEPLKLVIHTASLGYHGEEIAEEMREFVAEVSGECRRGIECEFADREYVVLMMTPQNRESDWTVLNQWIGSTRLCRRRNPLDSECGFPWKTPVRRMGIRQAVLSASETVPVQKAVGRILAQETVSCPPAVPIVISGEEITQEAVELFLRYGIEEVSVCRE